MYLILLSLYLTTSRPVVAKDTVLKHLREAFILLCSVFLVCLGLKLDNARYAFVT